MKIEMPEELKLFAGDHFFQMVLLIVISCGCMFMLVVLEAYLSFFLFAGGALILGAVECIMIRREERELAMMLEEGHQIRCFLLNIGN